VQETGAFAGEEVAQGWLIWPLDPYSYNTVNDLGRSAPSPPDGDHWLGTDDTARDVLARVIYGFRLSVTFALLVTFLTSVIGIFGGRDAGLFRRLLDLIFQRIIEIWNSTPQLYVIIIISAIFQMNFWLLVFLMVLFGWTGLVGVVRAEFLRARNFEYVRAAGRWACNWTIMFRHLLPNAMVATLTCCPSSSRARSGRWPRSTSSASACRPRPRRWANDAAGEEQPARAVAGLHRLLHLRDHAVAAGLRLRGRARRVRPAQDLRGRGPARCQRRYRTRGGGAEVRPRTSAT
jgi:hypothetical protein